MAEDTKIHIDDCWNRIGTWSENGSTCIRLQDVLHCMNCEVYAAAGRKLLQRRAPSGYLDEWQDVLAQPKKLRQTAWRSVVIFRVAEQWLALPTLMLEAIVEPRYVHSLPHNKNPALAGLVSVRGELLVSIHLGKLLCRDANAPIGGGSKNFPRTLVVRAGAWRGVFAVDEAFGVYRAPEAEIERSTSGHGNIHVHLLYGQFAWKQHQVLALHAENFTRALEGLRIK